MKQNRSSMVHQTASLNQLHIYGLVGIAIAYPIYSFLLTNPAYLVVNGVTSQHLYGIIALLSIVFPAILVLTDIILRFLPKPIYSFFHHLIIALLVSLSWLPLVSRFQTLSISLIFAIVAILTAFVIREYRTNQFTYICLAFLAPVAIAFPIHFASNHSISQILNPKSIENFEWQANEDDRLPPVVMIVFDEFPLVHLLDAKGGIDRKRFPNFALLADQATWYSYATTVYDQTIKAIPSILTGQYPVDDLTVPLPENYPGSLFNILRGRYRIHAFESVTKLSGDYDEGFDAPGVNTEMLATDITIFYARSLLPAKTADEWLPLEDGIWGGFLDRMPARKMEGSLAGVRQWINNNSPKGNRYRKLLNYVQEIASYPSNTFHYFHVTLPHRPYQFLPTGRQYSFSIHNKTSGFYTRRFDREAHILQVGLADTMLGNLRNELVKLGHWDDSIMIVVADHGEAYKPNQSNRIVTPENLGSVAFIPLLIKYPGQQKGTVDDSNVQTIDIAPTILDALDIRNGPRMEGRSLLDKNAPIPEFKKITSLSGTTYSIGEQAYKHRRAIAHKDAVRFFTLNDARSDLFNYGPGLHYVGAKLDTLTPYALPYQIGVYGLKNYQTIDLAAPRIPALVSGEVLKSPKLKPKNLIIAISVNGTIRAVTRPYYSKDGKLCFHKILPESSFEKTNDLVVLLLPRERPKPESKNGGE